MTKQQKSVLLGLFLISTGLLLINEYPAAQFFFACTGGLAVYYEYKSKT